MQINPHESIKFFNESHLKISAPAKPEDEDDKLKGNDKLKCDHDNYQLLEKHLVVCREILIARHAAYISQFWDLLWYLVIRY